MSVCFEIPDALIKGQPVQVFQAQSLAAVSDFAVDCGQYNAVTIEVHQLSGQADITVLGAAYEGGQYLLLPDINATQNATNTSKSFDVTVGSRFVKVQLANVTGSFTIYVTPYISAGMSQVEASIIVNTLSAIQTKTGNLTVTGTLDVSTSGVIKSGQTAYNTGTGFWLEYNGGTPRFSLGNPTGNRLTWDGTSLTVTGNLSATTGTIGGWTIGATSLTSGSGANTVGLDSGGTNPAIYAGSATPGSAPFRVTQAGALTATSATITGAITATSGSINGVLNVGTSGGIFQGTGTFASPTTGLKIYNSGGVGLLEMWGGGVKQVYFGTDGKLYANAGKTWIDSSSFYLTVDSPAGTVTYQSINFINGSDVLAEILAGLTVPGGPQINIFAKSRASDVFADAYLYAQDWTGAFTGVNAHHEGGSSLFTLRVGNSLVGYITPSYTQIRNTLIATTLIQSGTNPGTTGVIGISNASWITGRNATNNGDINMWQVNSGNLIAAGANLAAFTLAGNLTISGAVTIDTLNLATHDHTGVAGHGAQIANITGNAATVTGLSVTAGKTLTVSNSLALTATDGSTLAIGAGGTLASMAYQAASAVAITGGTLAGLTGLAIRDTSAAFDVTIAATSSIALAAARTLTIDMVNTAATIKLGYNLTLSAAANIGGTHSGTSSGTNTGDQTITLTGAVTGSGTGSFATTIATPGTLTVATTNSTATAHTHAITSTAIATAAASLLACDANGYLQLVKLGLGVAPTSALTISQATAIGADVESTYTAGHANAIAGTAITSNANDNRAYYANAVNAGAGKAFSFYGAAGTLYNASNVGIGTTAPTTYLHGSSGLSIYKSDYPGLSIGNAGTNNKDWLLWMTGDDLRVFESGNLHGSGNDRVTFQAGGNVGIGTTTPGGHGSGASGPYLDLAASSTNLAEFYLGNGATASGAILGTVGFYGGSSGAEKRAALILGQLDATSTINPYGCLSFQTAINGGIAERMRISSSGKVGIGTSSPNNLLELAQSSAVLVTPFFLNNDQLNGSFSAAVNLKFGSSLNATRWATIGLEGDGSSTFNLNIKNNEPTGKIQFYANSILVSTLYPSGGAYIGSSQSDPGAENLSAKILIGRTSVRIPAAANASPATGDMYVDAAAGRLYVYHSAGWHYASLT